MSLIRLSTRLLNVGVHRQLVLDTQKCFARTYIRPTTGSTAFETLSPSISAIRAQAYSTAEGNAGLAEVTAARELREQLVKDYRHHEKTRKRPPLFHGWSLCEIFALFGIPAMLLLWVWWFLVDFIYGNYFYKEPLISTKYHESLQD